MRVRTKKGRPRWGLAWAKEPATRLGRLPQVALLVVVGVGLALAWPWSMDMIRTPVVMPFEQLMGAPPAGTLPIRGGELRPGGAPPVNPIPPSEDSRAQGQHLFLIYCAVCHGEDGKGNGPVASKMTLKPFDVTVSRPEEYIYTRIREGGVYMPSYREALTPAESWHVVNYVRSLQTP